MRFSRICTSAAGIIVFAVSLLLNAAQVAAQQQKLIPLKVGFLKIAGYANIYVAQKENMFRDNGLDVSSVFFRSSAEVVAAAQSGSIDIFCAFPSAVMSANERGFDFGTIFQNEITYDKGPDTGAILVLKDSAIEKRQGPCRKKTCRYGTVKPGNGRC